LKERAKKPDAMILDDLIGSGAGPQADNYSAWSITKKGLWITFDPYQVAAYAAGPQHILVPYSVLKDLIKPDGLIACSRMKLRDSHELEADIFSVIVRLRNRIGFTYGRGAVSNLPLAHHHSCQRLLISLRAPGRLALHGFVAGAMIQLWAAPLRLLHFDLSRVRLVEVTPHRIHPQLINAFETAAAAAVTAL